jgi:uncharacterized protein YlxW (UPF0749 family)
MRPSVGEWWATNVKPKAVLGVQQTPKLLVLAMLVATATVLAFGQYPHHELADRNATTVGKIVGAPAFVVALRLVVMYVVVFVLASVIARIWKGHWLRRAGPFEVADEVQTVIEERDRLKTEVKAAEDRIGRLTDSLRSSNTLARRLQQALTERPARRPWRPVKLPGR